MQVMKEMGYTDLLLRTVIVNVEPWPLEEERTERARINAEESCYIEDLLTSCYA